jgi:hypothetical protein
VSNRKRMWLLLTTTMVCFSVPQGSTR